MTPREITRRPSRQRYLRQAFYGLLAVLLAGLIATAWYAYDKGFTRKWRTLISEQFRKQGLEVSLRRLTLDPFRGLVAKDVKVFDAKDRRRTIAVIDEVMLGINYANALEGKTIVETLDLRDANLSLPLDPSNPRGERVEVTKLNARLFLPPQQIYLARAEAEIAGLRVYAAGRLINPQAFKPRHDSDSDSGTPARIAERVLEEIKALKFEGPTPLLTLQFSGDLAHLEKLSVDLRIKAERVRRREYRADQLDLAAKLRDGTIELECCDLRDRKGTLQAHASYEIATRDAEARLRSSLDLPALVRALNLYPELKEWAFYAAPQVELTGKASFGAQPRFEMLGHVGLQKFAYKSVVFDALSLDGSWDGSRWSLRDIRLGHRTGELTGDIVRLPGDFRARVHSSVSAKLIAPLLRGKAAEWFTGFKFDDSPGFEIDVRNAEQSAEAPENSTPPAAAEPLAAHP